MKKFCILALAAACATPAMADEFYTGASVGRTEHKLNVSGISLDDNGTGYKVFGGYQYNKNVGAEVGYADLGKGAVSGGGATVSAKTKAVYAAVTGTLPLTNEIAVFGKLGAARNRTTMDATIGKVTDSAKENRTSLLFGLGASYAVTDKVAIVAEYENFGKVAKDGGDNLKVDQLSVGVRVKF